MKTKNRLMALQQLRQNGKYVSLIELEIRAESWSAYQFNIAHCTHKSFPVLVDRGVWKSALTLNRDAIAEANVQQPGCIYHSPKILAEIERQTAVAAHGVDRSASFDAKKWLQKVCIPRSMQTDRPSLGQRHFFSYPDLYEDIVLVRGVLNELTSRLGGGPPPEGLKEVFPDLRRLPEEWFNVICGEPIDEGKVICGEPIYESMVCGSPIQAADWVLGAITHYTGRMIRKMRSVFLPAKSWRPAKEARDARAAHRVDVIMGRCKKEDTPESWKTSEPAQPPALAAPTAGPAPKSSCRAVVPSKKPRSRRKR